MLEQNPSTLLAVEESSQIISKSDAAEGKNQCKRF
jgi:hypothetical protein